MVEHLLMVGLQRVDKSILYVDAFFLQPVLHDWCNKGCAMYYHVCEMLLIKDRKE